MGTGIFNHVRDFGNKIRGSRYSQAVENRVRGEYSAWKDLFDGSVGDEMKQNISTLQMRKQRPGMPQSGLDAIDNVMPTLGNATLRSFTSGGAGKSAMIGAGLGAGYGFYDSDNTALSGAAKGASLGYLGKGLFGIAGERKTLGRLANDEIKSWVKP